MPKRHRFETFGEKVGVTNKTIFRWETGNYLPPADAFLTMRVMYGVSVNGLFSGHCLKKEEYRQANHILAFFDIFSYMCYT